MTERFLWGVRGDLSRPHPFAAERVGFISIRAASTPRYLVLLADGYHPVADGDYVDDPSVGAMMGHDAIRKALDLALLQPLGMFHVHLHEHVGHPSFSPVDLAGQADFVPDFFKVRPRLPHGAIVLSHDHAVARAWLTPGTVVGVSEFNVMGQRVRIDLTAPGAAWRLSHDESPRF